jgi:type 1 glutamine amidotransferase
MAFCQTLFGNFARKVKYWYYSVNTCIFIGIFRQGAPFFQCEIACAFLDAGVNCINAPVDSGLKKEEIMSFRKLFFSVALLGMAGSIWAQNRPGIDRPIRVAMFRGTGNTYWHSNIHTSHTVMASMLGNPSAAGLGDSLVIPTAGFYFRTMPTAAGTGGPDGTCGGSSTCGPDAATIASFVAYLQDSADVMILSSVVNFGFRVTNAAQREAIANFWTTKGYVGIHAISDSKGTWAPLDTIHGTQFNNHPAEQTARIRVDSANSTDSSWRFLNRGMFSNGADTSFFEEWFFFTNSGAQIRARSNLKPTTKLIETGMNVSEGLKMGENHPHSWFRTLPTGGRTFYTGMGHRPDVWQGVRTFRRQIYNAILWTAKYDSLSKVVAINPGRKAPGAATLYSRLAAGRGTLTVTTIQPGSHKVELLGVNGSRIAMQQGTGADRAYNFTGLRAGVYAVAVTGPAGRSHRLVTIQ